MSYYDILNVSKNATNDQIKKAYKILATKWHPDKNNHPDANNMFMNISKAYQVLSDPLLRKKYDNGNDDVVNVTMRNPYELFNEIMQIISYVQQFVIPMLDNNDFFMKTLDIIIAGHSYVVEQYPPIIKQQPMLQHNKSPQNIQIEPKTAIKVMDNDDLNKLVELSYKNKL